MWLDWKIYRDYPFSFYALFSWLSVGVEVSVTCVSISLLCIQCFCFSVT